MASGEERRKREGSFHRGIRFGGERREKEERKRRERKEKEKTGDKKRKNKREGKREFSGVSMVEARRSKN